VTTYLVVGGDTLFSIARRFGTTVAQLQAWNADRYPALANDPGRLEAGWRLVVAATPGATAVPTPAATAPPATSPPTGPACRAGDRAGGGVVTYARIPSAGNEVALTFDMGGRMDPAAEIMNFLVANEVCATIFATGVMSETAQGRQVMAIIRAHPELFEIANHTMHHCDLVRGGSGSPTTAPCQTGGPPTASFIRQQLTDAEAILREGTGQQPQPYWRPPYGSVNDVVRSVAASVGYTKTFMWDIDTIDWKPVGDGGPTAAQIASKVISNAQDGSNVLFHLGGYNTLDALRLIVPGLRDRGMLVTSLSDLLDGR
jgi:peptidoglycan/xylan/chitin deacetylase (PgdA/CDA1 family)